MENHEGTPIYTKNRSCTRSHLSVGQKRAVETNVLVSMHWADFHAELAKSTEEDFLSVFSALNCSDTAEPRQPGTERPKKRRQASERPVHTSMTAPRHAIPATS